MARFLYLILLVTPTFGVKVNPAEFMETSTESQVPVGTPLEPEAGKKAIKGAMVDLAKDVVNAISPMKVSETALTKGVEAFAANSNLESWLKGKLGSMKSKDINLIPKALHLIGTEMAKGVNGGKVDTETLRKDIAKLPFSDELMAPHKKKFGFTQ